MRRILFLLLMIWPAATLATPHPSAAVGKLTVSDRSGCTATLIAADLVLTAAHCASEARIDSLLFTTGAYPGQPAVSRKVTEILRHPLYEPGGTDLRFDLAVVRLDTPIPAEAVRPLPLSNNPTADDRLLLVSWRGVAGQRGRERMCPVLEAQRVGVIIGCEVRQGESGAPLLTRTEQGLAITAVLTSRGKQGAQELGLAAPAGRVRQILALSGGS